MNILKGEREAVKFIETLIERSWPGRFGKTAHYTDRVSIAIAAAFYKYIFRGF
jgi:hypothetical protein